MLLERVKPIAPSPQELIPTREGNWYHKAKNITTEYVEADPQWWGKCFCFAIPAAYCVGKFT